MLPIRTYVRLNAWTKLLADIPVGITELGTLTKGQFLTLSTIAKRLTKKGPRHYRLSSSGLYTRGKGKVSVEVTL